MSGLDAFGTTLSYFDSTYIPIARITSLSLPGMSRETYDVTSHDSTGKWREFVAGVKDAGDISGSINLIPGTDFTIFSTLFGEETAYTWQIITPDGQIVEFDGFLTAFSGDAPFDGKFEADFTIKITGAVTFDEES
jgi:predicted secreted protein